MKTKKSESLKKELEVVSKARTLGDFDIAMNYVAEGEYEKAILELEKMANDIAFHHIAICYLRLGEIDLAVKNYRKSSLQCSKKAILDLYLNGTIPLDRSDYLKICKTLIENDFEEGYCYLSRLLCGYIKGTPINYKGGIAVLCKGIAKFGRTHSLIFELAHILHILPINEEYTKLSHYLFKTLIELKPEPVELNLGLLKRDYAQQFDFGIGCEVNKVEAIYWYKKAVEKFDYESAEALARIYSSEEGYIDITNAVYWRRKAEELKKTFGR